MTFLIAAAAAVATCSYIGDSIAVGLESVDKPCEVHAKVGASSEYIVKNYKGKDKEEYTVVSVGSNDPTNPRLYQNAVTLRNSFHQAQLIIWVLPRNRTAAAVIKRVALHYKDNWVDLNRFSSKDNIHPNSYRAVKKDIEEGINYYYD